MELPNSKIFVAIVALTALLLMYLILSSNPEAPFNNIRQQIIPKDGNGQREREQQQPSTSPCQRFPNQIGIEELKKYSLEDDALLDYIRCHHLFPPSTKPYPENMLKAFPSEFPSEQKTLFDKKTKGFFVESGANDGLLTSTTLVLERDQGWTGLLIEANPELIPQLKAANRKAWVSDVCLAPNNTVSELEFLVSTQNTRFFDKAIGKLNMEDDPDTLAQASSGSGNSATSTSASASTSTQKFSFKPYGAVRCFPLMLLLKAVNATHVDYLSLDLQGVDLKVLKTLSFDDKIQFDVIQAEHAHVPEGKPAMATFMKSKGFKAYHAGNWNYIFTRDSVALQPVE